MVNTSLPILSRMGYCLRRQITQREKLLLRDSALVWILNELTTFGTMPEWLSLFLIVFHFFWLKETSLEHLQLPALQ